MKTIFLNFFVLAAFILSAVRCGVDEQNNTVTHVVSDSVLKSQLRHIYTDSEKERVRKNVQGDFQGTFFHIIGGLHIRENSLKLDFMSKNNELVSILSSYIVSFDEDKPLLIFKVWGIQCKLNILFVRDGITDVAAFIDIDSPNYNIFFDRFEGRD